MDATPIRMRRLFGWDACCIALKLPTEGRKPIWTEMGLEFLEEILKTSVAPPSIGSGAGSLVEDPIGIVDDETTIDIITADTYAATNMPTTDDSDRPSQQGTLLDPEQPIGSSSLTRTQGVRKSCYSDYSPWRGEISGSWMPTSSSS